MVINETVVEFTQCSFTTLNKTIKFLVLAKETSIYSFYWNAMYTVDTPVTRKYNIFYDKMKQSLLVDKFLSCYITRFFYLQRVSMKRAALFVN